VWRPAPAAGSAFNSRRKRNGRGSWEKSDRPQKWLLLQAVGGKGLLLSFLRRLGRLGRLGLDHALLEFVHRPAVSTNFWVPV